MPELPFENLNVVLVSPRNPLNIGAAARAMANFGFEHLRVVNPYQLAFREAKSAVRASHILKSAQEFGSVAEAVADCSLVIGTSAMQNRETQHAVRELIDGARMARNRLKRQKVAVLFGSEKRGLCNDDLSHCHWLLHIPTREKHASMNLGQAVAVSLYEISRGLQRTKPPQTRIAVASSADMERVTALFLETLRTSGYPLSQTRTAFDEKLRRFVHRLQLSTEDAVTLLGFLRQIAWKLREDASGGERHQDQLP